MAGIKRFFLLVVLGCCVAACAPKDNPADAEPTVFSDFQFLPVVKVGEPALVTVQLSNPYGLNNAWLVYYLNADETRLYEGPGMMCGGVTTALFEGEIPAQKAGTKVSFRLAVFNTAGSLTTSEIFSFHVEEEDK